jgi:hypothetical protein
MPRTKPPPKERFSAIQKKGVRVSLRDALLEVFVEMGGKKTLLSWAKKNQTEYYKLTAKHTIPTRVELGGVDGEAIQLEMVNAAESARRKLNSAVEREGAGEPSPVTH